MAIKVKNIELMEVEGLWWRKFFEGDGRIGLELVGADKARYEPLNEAVKTIEKIIGLPESSLWTLIGKLRPDVKTEGGWLRVYLRAYFSVDQVQGE